MVRCLAFQVVGAGLLMMSVAACSPSVTLPTWCRAGANCVDAGLIDTPQGVLHRRGDCIWLDANDTEYAILWPPNYTAFVAPFTVLNASGKTVAVEGSRIGFNPLSGRSDTDGCGRSHWAAVSFGAEPDAG
jgi:hypothetical protein